MTFSFIRSDKRLHHSVDQTLYSLPAYSAVAGPIVCHVRNPYPTFPGGVHDFHGRLYPGLGRPPGRFIDCRCLDPFRTQAPHQCAGVQGGNIGPSTLGCSITGPSCYDRYRQYHCCSLHQQTGWDPFPSPVAAGSRSISVATDSEHNSASHTHSGLPQYHSRRVISAEPARHNRVESPPRSRESDIQTVGNSSRGHVCQSPQHASIPVYVSSSGASSTGDTCPVTGLAGEVDVHVSTISPAQQSHLEAQDHSGGRGDTHSPLVVVTTMVSRDSFSTAETCCHNRDIPPAASGTICMHEGLVQHYQAAGLSSEVSKLAAAPGRPSTNGMYEDRWLRFSNWATGVDPLGPTAAQIAAFLYELFATRGLSPQTIKGYRSCLASVLSRTGKAAAVQVKTQSRLRHDHVYGITEA